MKHISYIRIGMVDIVARLLSFPNVMVTSHQGFFTKEAMEAITYTTLENAKAFINKENLENKVS